jgi:phosphatidate cytidylyltransferase
MKKVLARLLVFALGLPAVLAVVFFFPQRNHLLANLAVIAASAIGAIEFAGIIGRRGYQLSKIEAAIIGAVLPMAATARVSFRVDAEWELIAFSVLGLWMLSSRVFSRREELQSITDRIISGFSVLLYPGSFMFWLVRLNAHESASILLITYLLMVFCNDSLAWLAGMLLGNGNRGFVAASPNKSVAGFIGGLIASVIIAFGALYFFPQAFPNPFGNRAIAAVLFGLSTGAAAIIGDLAESTMKRSVDVKDSGTLIPGRGGILDSIDSIAFAAPVYLAAFTLFFRP